MRILVDQDVYQVTVQFLRDLGHDVTRAADEGLARASDETILQHAAREKRVVVTRDKGFGALVFLAGHKTCGVVLLRMTPQTIESVHIELAKFLSQHGGMDLQGCFIVIEPGRHRIRRSLNSN